MKIDRWGHFVFYAQWLLAVLLPLFVFFGRGFVGSEVGWLAVIFLLYGIFIVLILLVPPVLTMFDREVRVAKATRSAYSLATRILWLAMLIAAISLVDFGDNGAFNSALMTWTSGGIGERASVLIFTIAEIVAGIAYVAALVLAIVGISRGARSTVGAAVDGAG